MSHLAQLADFAFRRRRLVLAGWVAVLLAIVALAAALRGDWSVDYATPGSESKAAVDLLADRFPERRPDSIDVVWQARDALAPDVRARMDAFIRAAAALDGVGDAVPAARADVSREGTIAVARLPLTVSPGAVPLETGNRLIDMAAERSGDGVRVELGGQAVGNAQRGEVSSETVGFAIAALVLLLTFGTVVASGLPLATALFGLGISSALVGMLAAVVDTPDWAESVAAMIGIGVGIDYALLILTRFRAALARGLEPRAATIEAVAHAGRSVLVAGSTVVISLLGLFVVGLPYLYGVALAAILAVLVVMAASLTLLPALLGFARERVNRLRVPFTGRARTDSGSPAARWSRAVQRRPWAAAAVAVLVLLALASPVAGLRLAYPDQGNDPQGTTTRAAFELVERGFGPGAGGPLVLAADVRPGGRAAVEALPARLEAMPGVASVTPPAFNRAGDAAVLTVVPTTSPQDTRTETLVESLRETLPASVHVGGPTATAIDQSDATAARLPLFIGAVVGLSLLLLLVAFRSLAVALKAGVMNLLSVATAFGIVALVAEGGWAGQLVGIDTSTPVPPFIPVIMFAVLFGLSMDYEVFLLSRVREAVDAGRDTASAVTEGLSRTARVITAAAAIMVAVFGAFALSDQVFLKLIGIGMASAIAVDATIVRMVLVPAVMQILGDRSWWLPRWLDRVIPRATLEPEPVHP